MVIHTFRRIARWFEKDGWQGSSRRIRYILRYWHFRFLVLRLRRKYLPVVPEYRSPGGRSDLMFSLLLVAFRTRPSWLREAVASVRQQTYPYWELHIGLCEVEPALRAEILKLAEADPRIRVLDLSENMGIAGNTNKLAEDATGEFLAVLDHDDYLEPHALQELAPLVASGDFDLVYTDEDLVTARLGLPFYPNYKPEWAPDSLHSYNYICHFCCFRRRLFEEVGGFRREYDTAQDYDLFLRLVEKTDRIGHISKVLYHWRHHPLSSLSGSLDKLPAWEAGRAALQSHLERSGESAVAEKAPYFATYRVRYPVQAGLTVNIIVFPGHHGDMGRRLKNLLTRTAYPRFIVSVLLDDAHRTAFSINDVLRDPRVKFTSLEPEFNWGRSANISGQDSPADILVFMAAETEIIHENWLDALVEHAQRDGVGAVGPMLLSPRGSVLHAGMAVDKEAAHAQSYADSLKYNGYPFRIETVQNVSALSSACLCVRRDAFLAMGGFDERLPAGLSVVDYCLRAAHSQYSVIYTPFTRMIYTGKEADLEVNGAEAQKVLEGHFLEGIRGTGNETRLFKSKANLRYLASGHWASIR